MDALRKDAISFIPGGLVGAFIFTLMYGSIKSTLLFNKVAGGKAMLADVGIDKYTSLIPSMPAYIVAGTIATVFILIAWKLPNKAEIKN